MKKNLTILTLILISSLTVVSCGKDTPEDQNKSLKGKWMKSQTLTCGQTTQIDPARARLLDYDNHILKVTDWIAPNCTFVTAHNVNFPSSTAVSIDTMQSIDFEKRGGCATAGVTQRYLDARKNSFSSVTYSYDISGKQLTLTTPKICTNADGTTGFEKEVFIRQ